MLEPDDPNEYFAGEILMRSALAKLGYIIAFEKDNPTQRTPAIMISEKDNALMFSVYGPDTTVKTKLKFPHGAPLLLGYETVMEDGFSTYRFPRADHRECRLFVEQQSGRLSCKELPPISYYIRRRLELSGLKNATVRLRAEKYCESNVEVRLNSSQPYVLSDDFDASYVLINGAVYYEMRNITGRLTLSMPGILDK